METPADCNWIYPPNPLAEEEVKLDITWIADAKTGRRTGAASSLLRVCQRQGLPSSDYRHAARRRRRGHGAL